MVCRKSDCKLEKAVAIPTARRDIACRIHSRRIALESAFFSSVEELVREGRNLLGQIGERAPGF
jgi:hypothetical protein